MIKKLKKDDLVKIMKGKDAGRTGRIIKIDHERDRVWVEGCNMKKKMVRPKSQNEQGGIIDVEGPIHVSNVIFLSKNSTPSRIGFKLEKGKKVRVAKQTREVLNG
jgi:large subunit ribosomal protein L24